MVTSGSCGLIQGSGSCRFAALPCWNRMMDAVFSKSLLSDCRQHCGRSGGAGRSRSPWRVRSGPGTGCRDIRGHGVSGGNRSAKLLPALPARFLRTPAMHDRRFRSDGLVRRPGRWRYRLGNFAGRSRCRPGSKGGRVRPKPGQVGPDSRINNADNTYYVKWHVEPQQRQTLHGVGRSRFKSMS